MEPIRINRLSHFPKQPNPVSFELTATGSDGKTAVDTVEISTMPDNLSVTVAEYRTETRNWRIDGTSDVFGPGVKVTIKIVDSANPDGKVLGTTTVDNAGIWRFRSTNSNIAILQGGTPYRRINLRWKTNQTTSNHQKLKFSFINKTPIRTVLVNHLIGVFHLY